MRLSKSSSSRSRSKAAAGSRGQGGGEGARPIKATGVLPQPAAAVGRAGSSHGLVDGSCGAQGALGAAGPGLGARGAPAVAPVLVPVARGAATRSPHGTLTPSADSGKRAWEKVQAQALGKQLLRFALIK